MLFFTVGVVRPVFPESDNYEYTRMYLQILETGEVPFYIETKEVGYKLVNQFFALLDLQPIWLFGFFTLLTWLFFTSAFKNYSHLFALGLFFTICNGFLLWSFNGVRQSVAIMIFFYATKFVMSGDWKKYTIWMCVAMLFHYSAILMLPVYLFRYVAFNRVAFMVLFALSIGFLGNDIFVEILKSTLISIVEAIGISTGYEHYVLKDAFKMDPESGNHSGLGVILRLASTFYILFLGKMVLKRMPEFEFYYACFLIAALLQNLFFGVEVIGRLAIYFNIVFGILMAVSVYYSRPIVFKFAALGLMALFYSMFLVVHYRLFY